MDVSEIRPMQYHANEAKIGSFVLSGKDIDDPWTLHSIVSPGENRW